MFSLYPQNSVSIKEWTIVFTGGQCQGQYRQLLNYALVSAGENVTFSPLSATNGSTAGGPFGNQLWTSWNGCKAPDSTTTYTLIPKSAAPGSMAGSTFAVRWAGYLSTSTTSQYTFRTLLSTANANVERVKVNDVSIPFNILQTGKYKYDT
jgi:hypothetical protein